MVALLTPAPGASVDDKTESGLIDQQEAASITIPQSPPPGLQIVEQDLGVGELEIKGFSRVCTPKVHGFYSNKIERLCSSCSRERDEERELAEMKMIEAQRRASQLNTEPGREYATDRESLLSASEVETGSVKSMKSPASSLKSPENGTQQRKTSSGMSGFLNAFKRTS